MTFEWGEEKDAGNIIKHGLAFDIAKTVWLDAHSIEYFDTLHSVDEDRFIKIGYSNNGQLLTIVFTERAGRIRIISARPATFLERIKYEEGI